MSTQKQAAKTEEVKQVGQVLIVKNPPMKPAAEEQKADEKPQEKPVVNLVPQSAEQRLKNLGDFQVLGKRYEFLQKKKSELKTFSVSNDETQEKLKLTNASGFSFELSNSNVIAEVVEVISLHLGKKMQSTEEEILNFAI